MKKLYVVIPCYNEEEVIDETTKRLTTKLEKLIEKNIITKDSKILYIDDGSRDKTWEKIEEFNKSNEYVTGIKLSRNMGHQNALLAGLMTAKDYCDISISMDSDLQDDIDAIDEMIEKYNNGAEIVYGIRSSRKKDTIFKKHTAQLFYKIMDKVGGVDIVYNHADYRLMSKTALLAMAEFKEVNLFLRGIVPLVGFEADVVEYERGERFAGESKYPLKKMINFALDGITSLSNKPIRLIFISGLLIFMASILVIIYFIYVYISGKSVTGWASITVSIWAIGGLQLLSIGIIGEYLGKMYLETKNRPRFIIEKHIQ